MWKGFDKIGDIIPITNSQNQSFWQDENIKKAWKLKSAKKFIGRKKDLKKELFEEVFNQTGKIFDPNVLTIVWARRFAGYKRADMLLYDKERFEKLLSNDKYPVQIIWANYPRSFWYKRHDRRL